MDGKILTANDLKKTRSRQAVLETLEKASLPLTAEEIHASVLKVTHTSISTTYRTLATLWDKGLVLKNLNQDGKAYYQINNHQHKHYLVCTVCSQIKMIEHCPLQEWEDNLAQKTGFIITGHNLEVAGVCPVCAKKMKISDP